MSNTLFIKAKDTYHKIMNLPDAPNKIAGGIALGVAVDFLPIPLIGIVVGYFLARAVGLNGLATVLTAMLFKILVPLFYMADIMVGRLILSGWTEMAFAVTEPNFTDPYAWLAWLKALGIPLLVGASINAVVAYTVVYFVTRKLLIYRQHRYTQKYKLQQQPSNK